MRKTGIINTEKLYDKVLTKIDRQKLVDSTRIDYTEILELIKLTDLSRIKWVGVTYAQMLYYFGLDTVEKVSKKERVEVMDKKERKMTNNNKSDWFTIERIDDNTSIISEYKHWEETHCYVLNGTEKCLLIDTGLGVENILEQVQKLTDKPVTVITTHVHYDHFGGHKYFPDFYVHEAETEWINGGFPLTIEQVRNFLIEEPCDFPNDFDVNNYNLFKGSPTRVLKDNDTIELGKRTIQVLHTPGHSPGHMCFFEKDKGYLYTGDLIYMDVLFADFPSTDPIAYMNSIKKLLLLPVKRILPAHHDLNVPLSIIKDMDNAFSELYKKGKLKHGSGTYSYEKFGIRL